MTALTLGSLSAFLSVAFGAFGAHALKSRLAPDLLAVFHTGVQYQGFHALALLLLGVLHAQGADQNAGALRWATWAFGIGTLLFSGSLYLLALTGVRKWGMVTPLGGVSFLLGWIFCILYSLRISR
jgi:uncharacterized membrane protein YgdD (TMEM256/DUF423 family)